MPRRIIWRHTGATYIGIAVVMAVYPLVVSHSLGDDPLVGLVICWLIASLCLSAGFGFMAAGARTIPGLIVGLTLAIMTFVAIAVAINLAIAFGLPR